MYCPKAFKIDDSRKYLEFMNRYPFATFVSNCGDLPAVSHIPFTIEIQENQVYLRGHLAKANPHWEGLPEKGLAIFNGPHGYISPEWYENNEQVPTWNFGVVHAAGNLSLVEDPAWLNNHLQRSINTAGVDSICDSFELPIITYTFYDNNPLNRLN